VAPLKAAEAKPSVKKTVKKAKPAKAAVKKAEPAVKEKPKKESKPAPKKKTKPAPKKETNPAPKKETKPAPAAPPVVKEEKPAEAKKFIKPGRLVAGPVHLQEIVCRLFPISNKCCNFAP
ncbi:MAG: hypothetical protein NTW31_12765, partial [Bacteroidetes bacterium]|nr:hypothetical protein [Bacteroidota bacterium]